MSGIASIDQRWLREGARDEDEFAGFLSRRAAGEPVHRILGWREFWGLCFFLSPETLEPRPDSETVIEVLLSYRQNIIGDDIRFLDLGTGTGCLLLSALHEFPCAKGVGVDAAMGAVVTAQRNAAHNGLDNRAAFQVTDWNDVAELMRLGAFDVVLCNPPYIPTDDIAGLSPEVRDHDPMRALDGGGDGLSAYRHIAAQLSYLLKPGGIAIFEIGYHQAAEVQDIITQLNLVASQPYQDLGGNNRVIVAARQ